MKHSTLEKLPNTPMWVQYASIKKDALDSLLLYRMGDFYELFLDDATEAAGLLGITLTARNKGEGIPIPMCGVPFHSATAYINRLLKAGKRVAICEQTEEASATKGIVKREIVRIVSPGMAYDTDALESEQNNYLLVLHPSKTDPRAGSYCQADLSTGSLEYASYSSLDQLADDLALSQPKEVVVSTELVDTASWNDLVNKVGKEFFPCVTPAPNFYFSPENSVQDLCRHFSVLNLEGFGLAGDHPAIGAVGAAFRSIRDSQKQADLRHLQPPQPKTRQGFVQLDQSTIDHLDLFPKPGQNPEDSAFHHLNRTTTAIGARKLREILSRPLASKGAILERQQSIAEFRDQPSLLRRLRDQLSGMRDIERLIAKVGLRTAGPRDLQALQEIFTRLPSLKETLKVASSPLLLTLEDKLAPFTHLESLLQTRLREELPPVSREGNIFRAGWHPELDELIALTEDGKDILLKMEERERNTTGISSLKIKYNRVFGYFLEVTNSNLANVPAHYIRKQTTANGERYLTDELKKFKDKILSAQDKRIALEESLFQETLKQVGLESQKILATAHELALLDALQSLALAALEYGYVVPEILEDGKLEIINGRHPALEHLVGRDKFIANSVSFSAKERIFLITGPNMAGKSTFMRQVALITLLAHTGSLIPAESAKVGLVDRIATRVGASDRIGRGQSTFMVEMNETARILRQSTGKSLLIIDEIGRGTSTFDGLAIAWAIVEDLAERLSCRTLFATHYHELTGLEQRYSSVRNLCVAVEEQNGEVVFLHEVRRGKAPGSYGIEVAKLAGLPPPVVDRARTILETLERGSGRIQKAQKEAIQKDAQLTFFSRPPEVAAPPKHLLELEQALRRIDPNNCSPMEALLLVQGWKEGLPPPSSS